MAFALSYSANDFAALVGAIDCTEMSKSLI